MINKKDLKDWLDESGRKAYEEKLENYIDEKIKQNALAGNTTFFIRTGRWGTRTSEETPFYDLWYTDEISKENRKVVHDNIIQKYQENGFDVEKTRVDCGWNNHYFALKFNKIDLLIKEETK